LVTARVKRRGKERPIEEVEQRRETLSGISSQIAAVVIWIVAAFMILSEIGVNIGPLLAAAGVIGIAVGFGAQSLIRDMLNGFFILMEDQFAVGDWVTVAGVSGAVENIGLRRTVLRDLDGVCHTVPNGEIRTASNWTKDWGGVNLNISVAYGEDLDHAIEVINRVCREMAMEEYWRFRLLSTPQVVRVDNLGDSGIDIKILGQTKAEYQWQVMGELRKRIKKTFDEEGIEIPWPHMKVYFGEAASNRKAAVIGQEGRKDAPFSYRRRVPRKRTYGHRRGGPGRTSSR
jgi:small conductance mechanosensitive channel